MGQIFSWNQIATERVPYPEELQEASTLLAERFSEMIEAPHSGVLTAIIHGSVNRQPTSRSDIDLFVVTHGHVAHQLGRVGLAIHEIRERFGNRDLDIGVDVLSHENIARGNHTISAARMKYLFRGDHLLLGKNIKDEVDYTCDRVRFLHDSIRIFHERVWLMSKYAMTPHLDISLHGSLLKLPDGVCRNICDIADDPVDVINKQIITQKAAEILGDPGKLASQALHRLRAYDVAYTSVLYEAMAGEWNEADYNEYLLSTKSEACYATMWLPLVVSWIKQKLHQERSAGSIA